MLSKPRPSLVAKFPTVRTSARKNLQNRSRRPARSTQKLKNRTFPGERAAGRPASRRLKINFFCNYKHIFSLSTYESFSARTALAVSGGSTELVDILQGGSIWTAVYGKVFFFRSEQVWRSTVDLKKKLFSKNSLKKIILSFDEL
jgi:hypothetical protein